MDTEPHKEQRAEIPLLGGRLTPGIARVGKTVRRPPKGHAAFVHDLLLGLQDQDFPFAPRFLGMDSRGRDILSYLEGETWSDSGSGLSDDLLVQAAGPSGAIMMPRLAQSFRKGAKLWPIMSWDPITPFSTKDTWLASSIGMMRLLAYDCATRANAVYKYVDVSHWTNQEASEQARRIGLMCIAYAYDLVGPKE